MIEPVSTEAPRAARPGDDEPGLARPHLPALGRRARTGRAPDAAGRASGHARRDDVRRADPVPDGRRRRRSRAGVPWAGTFLETNVRLYSVDETGRRGIVFLSLDTDRSIVVAGARAGFGLPYRWARMRYAASGDVAHLRRPPAVAGRAEPRAGSSYAPGEPRPSHAARRLRQRPLGSARARGGAAPCTSPTSTSRGRSTTPRCWSSTTGCSARSGSGSWRGERPDHVAFSPGVHTEFGFPNDARRPRASSDQPLLHRGAVDAEGAGGGGHAPRCRPAASTP